MRFIPSDKSHISTELDIMNSQPDYNLLSEGKTVLSKEDLIGEHTEGEIEKERYIIKKDGENLGIIDFIMKNPKDGKPWLGLLIIDKKFEGASNAQEAFEYYEELMKERHIQEIRLGCFLENERGLGFWKKQKFEVINEIDFKGKPLCIMEKRIN